jgi:pyruvate dehydrogenase E1 component alpha subunit
MGVVVVTNETDPRKYDAIVLMNLYRVMVKIRKFDENIIRLLKEGKVSGIYHSGIGQEAIAAGSCSLLRDEDYIFYAHRGANEMIAKGVPLVNLFGDFMGRVIGLTRGLGAGIVHCADPSRGVLGQSGTVGACFVLAPGVGYAIKYKKTDQVCICYFGDGTAARELFHGGMNFAGLHKLPVIFLCENNEYAIGSHFKSDHSIKEYIAERAEGYCIPAYVIDGNDVLMVRETTEMAIKRAKKGEGPTFIEAKTFRQRAHFEGDPGKYMNPEVVKYWKEKRDPIANFKLKLIQAGMAKEAEFEQVDNDVSREIGDSIEKADASPLPTQDRIYQGLFSQETM